MKLQIAPSILAADFARLADEIARVEAGGADLIHIDVMDGHFVPNITIGIPVVAALRQATSLPLDVHLMIEAPDRYVDAFVEAGAAMVTVHVEAARHLHRTVTRIRQLGAKAGVALNPATPLDTIEEITGDVDHVLIMSVNPGFGGQSFITRSIDKIAEAQRLLDHAGHTAAIEVDGGVDAGNAGPLVRAGASILVAGVSIFRTDDPAAATRALRAAGEAR